MKTAIFDLDGTISDDRRRRHLLPLHGTCDADYDAYHADCGNDPLVNGDLVREHIRLGHCIAFVTARPKKFYSETYNWIARNFPEMKVWSLLMRPDGNNTHAAQLKVELIREHPEIFWGDIVAAYDDREDVLAAYEQCCYPGTEMHKVVLSNPVSADALLHGMAETFRERNAVYGSNYRMVGPIMRILFPDGIPPELLHSDHFHLFELKIVKLSRFAISGLTHIDSIHDDAVYSAMIESILREKESQQ